MSNEKREQQMMDAAEAYAAEIYMDEPDNFDTDEQLCETINDFCAGWRAADSRPQWIPVEERLPEENQRVRAWSLENNEEYLCDYHDGIFEDFYGTFTDGKITHWMEIVPPRKEANNERYNNASLHEHCRK